MYIRLTPEREFTLGMIARLLPAHSHVLSDFEKALADQVVQRANPVDAKEAPPVTDAEWTILEEVAQVMANDLAQSSAVAA